MLSGLAISIVTVIELVEQAKRGADFFHRPRPLHPARSQEYLQRGISPLDDMDYVANRGAGGGSHQSDPLRIARQRAFAFLREEAFGKEFLFKLLTRGLQCAEPFEFDSQGPQLV